MSQAIIGAAAAAALVFIGILGAGCQPDAADVSSERAARGEVVPDNAVPPSTLDLPVWVEGTEEMRTGSRERSPQDYYLYALERFTFTPEEPGRDLLFYRADDRYWARIEKLDPKLDLSQARQQATATLKELGAVHEMKGGEIQAGWRDARLFLHSGTAKLSKYVVIRDVQGTPFRFTLHLPNGDAVEGVAPSLWAMLASIRLPMSGAGTSEAGRVPALTR